MPKYYKRMVDPRWVVPVPSKVVEMAAEHRLVVSLEDCGRHGGFGSSLAAALRDAEVDVPLRDLAVPNNFLHHSSREEVLADLGLTETDIATRINDWVTSRRGAQLRVATEAAHG